MEDNIPLNISLEILYTWPRARAATRTLLQFLTAEVVLGSQGCRYISGDFNGSEEDYPELQQWLDAGWQEVQMLQCSRYGDPLLPTCKGSTRPDRVYLSPELARHFQSCQVLDYFADHSVLASFFDFPLDAQPVTWWPKASKIPWHAIDMEKWRNAEHAFAPFDPSSDDTTEYYRQLGKTYEDSFIGCFQPQPHEGLPRVCRGRAQVFEPVQRDAQMPKLRPSRQGEEVTSSDMICRSLQRWFTQLRRLQSLLHNLRRDSDLPSAVAYRLQTWQAIKHAKGFSPDFMTWWAVRPIQHPGVGTQLPDALPNVAFMNHIYEDFKDNYRSLEAWNLRHRAQVLKVAAKEQMRLAFRAVLGEAESKQVDSFTSSGAALLLAVDAATSQVHTDRDLQPSAEARWTLDGIPAQVRRLDVCLFEVDCDILMTPQQELQFEQITGDTPTMLEQLSAFWRKRWNRDVLPGPADWQRILNFVRAFVPPMPLRLPPITVAQWDQINQRYNSRSASGPDAMDFHDLLCMPLPFKEGLVSLLNAIENGSQWPRQLLQGFGICIPKHNLASEISEFRPIVVLSQVYRSWSAIRARALLSHLSHFAPSGVKGFLPQRETGDIWHHIQMLVEVCLQQQLPISGVISDVKKAFESVPRGPLLQVALQLGLPAHVLNPWQRFLGAVQRRFLLHQQVGEAISSNHGMPEGDGLSVVGMTVIDLCWDFYQRCFAPATMPLSFVDNYEILAARCSDVLHGFGVLEEYMALWMLELSPSKTHFWSTSPSDRAALRRLGKSVTLQTADLGGAMTFCRRRTAGTQLQRLALLDKLWQPLRRAGLPTAVKELVLRQALWCKAFYAIGITLLPWKEVQGLRTKAVRALGFGCAGAHPGLRLGLLSQDATADPGCFQLVRVFMDFQRFLRKHPSVLEQWVSFMDHFDGTMFSGPLSKLLEQCELIRWTVRSPPYVEDHDGCRHNLLTMPRTLLRSLLLDAWRQRLATEVQHRDDFAGLQGLQWPPSRHEQRLDAISAARVNSLREGAFVTGMAHGKFDLVKGSLCPTCGQPDTWTHRALHCIQTVTLRQRHAEVVRLWTQVPRALSEHLLPCRNRFEVLRKKLLLSQVDMGSRFCLNAFPIGQHDLFSDGSCSQPATPCLSRASWAVVSATHKAVLSAGLVPGLIQNVDRAELCAAVSAARWTWESATTATLWTGSAYVGSGICAILDAKAAVPHDTNKDLWEEMTEYLLALPVGAFGVQHVASHRDPAEQTTEVDAWTATWNGFADRQARRTLNELSPAASQVFQNYEAEFHRSEAQVDLFRTFHLAYAEQHAKPQGDPDDVDEGEVWRPSSLQRTPVEGGDWIDGLPLAWHNDWRGSSWCATFPLAVLQQVVDWLQTERMRAEVSSNFSWLELVAMLEGSNFVHPILVPNGVQNTWCNPFSVSAHLHRPLTMAARVRFVRDIFRALDRCFGHSFYSRY